MNKRTAIIVALLIFIPTVLLFLVSWLLQPLLPAPWNNILILLGVVVAGVLATISGVNDTVQLVDRLDGEKEDASEASSVKHVEGTDNSGAISAGGHVVGRDQVTFIGTDEAAAIWSRQYLGKSPPPDLEAATKRYLAYVAGRYEFLDFRGMGVHDRAPLRLPLAKMYVPLKARIEMPKGETWARELRLAGRRISEEEVEAMGQRLSEPQPVVDLLKKHDGLIVLGDPGAGKTTFLKYLALQLALGQGESLGLSQRLPVLLPLSAYANALAEEDVPLNRFIAHYYDDLGIEEPLAAMLKAALERGGALLLLDGLDEVQSVVDRHTVINRVLDFFTYHKRLGNKFILTSRIVGYREVRSSATTMSECTLVDFDEAEIEMFVTRWTAALENYAYNEPGVAAVEADQQRAELLHSVHHNPGVRQLAANPLLLTILALMKRQGVVLPERRVELYAQYVETLLKHWNLARGVGRPLIRDLDVGETLRVLEPLALWMHETSPGIGLVPRTEIEKHLQQIYEQRGSDAPQQSAQQLLRDARDYASLLLERGPGEYGFIHLTFQEYLAAVAIAQQGQRDLQPVTARFVQHLGDDSWHEVLLLATGYLGIVQRREEAASAVLLQLIADAPGKAGEAVILAGEAVVDTWPGGVTADCRRQTIAALTDAIGQDDTVAVQQRLLSGRVLGKLKDTQRPAVLTTEQMPMCYVPEGTFWMGEGDALHPNETGEGYWLGKYPVTQAQYGQFVTAGGYENAAFWAEALAANFWQKGRFKGGWDDDWRDRQVAYGFPFMLPNHPVVGVTWYEATAFCRWLTTQIEGATVVLPSEAEWEKGARGGKMIVSELLIEPLATLPSTLTVDLIANGQPQRRFPWGNDADVDNRANYRRKVLESSSAVGCFSHSCSPYGCEEMAGNVWEWTRSIDGKYPYVADDGREEAANVMPGSWMRLRGGSWPDDADALRCAYRYRSNPFARYGHLGFRVCVRPHFPAPSER